MFLPHPRVKVSIVGSLRDREVACSTSDRQGSNFESCVWRTVSSHHPQEVLLAQFSLYVHKGGLKPDSFHFVCRVKLYCRPIAVTRPDCSDVMLGQRRRRWAGADPGSEERVWGFGFPKFFCIFMLIKGTSSNNLANNRGSARLPPPLNLPLVG